jgi:hypothetical protein
MSHVRGNRPIAVVLPRLDTITDQRTLPAHLPQQGPAQRSSRYATILNSGSRFEFPRNLPKSHSAPDRDIDPHACQDPNWMRWRARTDWRIPKRNTSRSFHRHLSERPARRKEMNKSTKTRVTNSSTKCRSHRPEPTRESTRERPQTIQSNNFAYHLVHSLR